MNLGTRRPASIRRFEVAVLAAIVVLLPIVFAPAVYCANGKNAENCGPKGKGSCAGTMLTTYWDTGEVSTKNGTGEGDNILRILNPGVAPIRPFAALQSATPAP